MDFQGHYGAFTGRKSEKKFKKKNLYIHYLNFKGAVQIDFFLRDGVRICQLMNKIKENSINKQEIITGNIDAHRANIQAFIKAARTYGVPDKYLFEAGDKIFKFLLMNPPGPLKILAFLTLPPPVPLFN